MSEEKNVIDSLLSKVYNFISSHNWIEQLPISFSENYNHSKLGMMTFGLTLEFIDNQKFISGYSLKFMITKGNSIGRNGISFGKQSKVENDIKIFYEDSSGILNSLPQIYMGLFEYPDDRY